MLEKLGDLHQQVIKIKRPGAFQEQADLLAGRTSPSRWVDQLYLDTFTRSLELGIIGRPMDKSFQVLLDAESTRKPTLSSMVSSWYNAPFWDAKLS